jgi:hypothetical protein
MMGYFFSLIFFSFIFYVINRYNSSSTEKLIFENISNLKVVFAYAQLERSSENPRTYVGHMYSDISPYIVACRYHYGSDAPQTATVVVASCGVLLPINAGLWLESKMGTQLEAARHKMLPLQ